jgi:hypothetical protein
MEMGEEPEIKGSSPLLAGPSTKSRFVAEKNGHPSKAGGFWHG